MINSSGRADLRSGGSGGSAAAAVLDAAGLSRQTTSLQLPRFELSDAVRLGQLALARATAERLPVTIEVRVGNRIAFKSALPGTSAENDDWIARKFRVVRKYRRSSLAVWAEFEERELSFYEATGLPERQYAAVGGGWPIFTRADGLAGLFGVSGLPHIDDHRFIVETVETFLVSPSSTAASPAGRSRQW
jgi:uncharacterized protein (UPF0303 family)